MFEEEVQEKIDYDKRMMDAIMGPEGGEGWMFNTDESQTRLAKVMKVKVDQKLWDEEELRPEEVPEELKESGAIAVSLRDVKNCIGRDREQWK